MRRAVPATVAALPLLACACAHAPAPAPPPPARALAQPESAASAAAPPAAPAWPEPLAAAMKGRGEPHVQPLALGPDARGRERWLAFVGPPDVALGAWRVARDAAGETEVEPVERWPAAVRVVGGLARAGAAYVVLETVAALDQPPGLRGVWIDAGPRGSPFEASPLSFADVREVADLDARVARPPAPGSAERNAVSLLATLRAASGSTAMLVRTLAAEGADVGVVWQSIFAQRTAHLDGEGSAPAPAADRVLAAVRAAQTTQACGADACEAWTDSGHAVVRFVVQGGRWVIRAVYEDAPSPHAAAASPAREVAATADASATEAVLRARARRVDRVLGEAPLAPGGGTIGVGLTDSPPDVPVVVVREGAAARVLPIQAGTVRAEATEARWDAAFADVDGDGRTDVVAHMTGKRGDGTPVAWTQAFLAPAASVQPSSLEADLPSSLATMDAADAAAGAHAAASLPRGGPPHDEACRVLTTASTVAGFRRVATSDARVLLFAEPGMPTWRPKVVSGAKIGADDVRGLGAHCAELACSPTRMYCGWTAGADSLHAWFAWQGGQLVLSGAADYQGE